MRPRPARLSVPSLRLYCQMPGAGPSRAVRVIWTVPADRVAQALIVTVTIAPSTRVLTGPPPSGRALDLAGQAGVAGQGLAAASDAAGEELGSGDAEDGGELGDLPAGEAALPTASVAFGGADGGGGGP